MASKKAPQPAAAQSEGTHPGGAQSGGIAVGFLVAGMFAVGLVVLFLIGAWADSQGIPMLYLAIVLVPGLLGVFTLLRRWADKQDAKDAAAAESE